jgi:predicted secreted hydrolase
VKADDFAYRLSLRPDGPPLLNGAAGFSRKGPDPRQASYYYSRPRLAVSGTLSLDGRAQPVSGQAWLDHEWSSELLPEGAQGWDWIGINLDDGGALMAFRMRGKDGRALWAAATLQAAGGAVQVFAPEAVAFAGPHMALAADGHRTRWRGGCGWARGPSSWRRCSTTRSSTAAARPARCIGKARCASSKPAASGGAGIWR